YNLRSAAQLAELTPSLDWSRWCSAAGVLPAVLDEVVVAQPSYLEGIDALLVDDVIPAWSDWLRWQLVHAAAPYLSGAFVDENFAFYGRTLQGTDELRPRWKRGVGFVESAMGEAIGKI